MSGGQCLWATLYEEDKNTNVFFYYSFLEEKQPGISSTFHFKNNLFVIGRSNNIWAFVFKIEIQTVGEPVKMDLMAKAL